MKTQAVSVMSCLRLILKQDIKKLEEMAQHLHPRNDIDRWYRKKEMKTVASFTRIASSHEPLFCETDFQDYASPTNKII